jgi:hypothetical protein
MFCLMYETDDKLDIFPPIMSETNRRGLHNFSAAAMSYRDTVMEIIFTL